MCPGVSAAFRGRAPFEDASAQFVRAGGNRTPRAAPPSMNGQLLPEVDATRRWNREGWKEEAVLLPPASESASLRSNFSWMLAGNGIYAACQWGVLALFARLATPAVVGQYVLATAVTAPILAFFMLQIRMVQATDVRREYHFGHYLAV